MKILALYLPQYHQIPENDEWWGRGYTEWTAVKGAKPLYKKHDQPRIPLNKNYYDLSDSSAKTWGWQAQLAKEYGIYGFCIYHYWFGDKQLLEKPMEVLLKHPEIDIRYTVCWANETWTRTWYDKSEEILIEQKYGNEEEWIRHYQYLKQFFLDCRYIKVDNKPLVHIYRPADIYCLEDMLELWNDLAKADGFAGIKVITSKNSIGNKKINSQYIDGEYCFEPGYSTRNGMTVLEKINYFVPIAIKQTFNKMVGHTVFFERKINILSIYERALRNYRLLNEKGAKPVYIGGCPQWDNTPRRGSKGAIYYNSTPDNFKEFLKKVNKEVDVDEYVYINAWNEWGEGAYLEPDETNEYAYLKAIKDVIEGKD